MATAPFQADDLVTYDLDRKGLTYTVAACYEHTGSRGVTRWWVDAVAPHPTDPDGPAVQITALAAHFTPA